MPTLSSTQWQLLSVIVRQTQGWHDPQTGGRKRSDWLSHSQMRRRTGRGSDALCHAIDALVRKELIEVRDGPGHLLATPSERRRSGSRLFYSLSPQLLIHFEPTQPAKKAHHDSANHPAKMSQSISESRFGKAETTKETRTKERQKKPFAKAEWSPSTQDHTPLTPEATAEKGCGCFTSVFSPVLPASSAPAAERLLPLEVAVQDPQAVQFVEDYHTKHRHYFGASTSRTVPSLSPQQQSQVQAAMARYGRQRLSQLMEVFFKSDTVYIQRHGHSLPVFLSMLHVLPFLRSRPIAH